MNILRSTICLSTAFATLLALPSVTKAQVSVVAPDGGKGLQVISTESLGDEKGESHSLEIRVDNGKVSITRDGKAVPEAQIKQEDGNIIILDKNGNRLQSVQLRAAGKPGTVGVWTGTEGIDYLRAAQAMQGAAETPKVMLGVHMTEPGAALEYHLHLDSGTSTMIGGVYEGLPAYDAGMRQYDIIIKVDGQSPADHDSIKKVIADKEPGDTIEFTIIHEGKSKDVDVKLQAYDREAMAKASLQGGADNGIWSMYNVGDGQDLTLLKDLPMIQQLFVAPKEGETTPDTYTWQLYKRFADQNAAGAEGLDKQLERLDKRMAELEAMIEKLIQKQERER